MTEHEIEDLALKVADDWRERLRYESDWDLLEERVRNVLTYAVASDRMACIALVAALAREYREDAQIVEAETAEAICQLLARIQLGNVQG